jgi:Phage capsid family.
MELNDLSRELKDFTETATNKIAEQNLRLLQMEQKIAAPGGAGGPENPNDIGRAVTDSVQFKSFKDGTYAKTGRINVGSFHKTTIVNATGLNQPLVPPFYRPGIIAPGMQPLRIRDILPSFPVNSNMVEYVKETSSTNAAAMQSAEGAVKGESALGFTLSYAPVQTLAHWIPASKQVLDDAQALQGYNNQRLGYFLKLEEEDEILNGSGTGVELSGLTTTRRPTTPPTPMSRLIRSSMF